jgi:hypothetical protein
VLTISWNKKHTRTLHYRGVYVLFSIIQAQFTFFIDQLCKSKRGEHNGTKATGVFRRRDLTIKVTSSSKDWYYKFHNNIIYL